MGTDGASVAVLKKKKTFDVYTFRTSIMCSGQYKQDNRIIDLYLGAASSNLGRVTDYAD